MPDLFPYQETGREFLLAQRHALLADEPGLGKTPQAVRGAWSVGATKILVLCPLSAVANWKREFKRWWPQFNGHLVVINYDQLSIGNLPAANGAWDLVIADEAHWLKSTASKRTQVFYRTLAKASHRVWLLTGTPAPNHIGELFTHIRALRPDLIKTRNGTPMDQEQFETEYCKVGFDARGNRVIRGSKNIRQLKGILQKSGFMLRRMTKEVLPEMPDLLFDDYPLATTGASISAPDYPSLKGLSGDELFAALQEQTPHLATQRRLTGVAKIPLVVDAVNTEMQNVPKCLVFAYHREVIDALSKSFYLQGYKPVVIKGGTKDRQGIVDQFQKDPTVRVFIGQIQTCGEALTLTAARMVFFAEADWNPNANFQAAKRAHRIGQDHNVLARFLSVAGTTDELIQRVLARKTKELSELFG